MISIREYRPGGEQWLLLRESVGFVPYPPQAAQRGIDNALQCYCAFDGERLAGLVKIQGDGITCFLIHDLIVHPDFQGLGVGTALMRQALAYIRDVKADKASVCLFSAEGKESFYEKFGFKRRPYESRGCGMALDE